MSNLLRSISKVTRQVLWAMQRHSPEVLTACSVSGLVATTYLTIRGTVKAVRAVDKAQAEQEEPLTTKDILKLVWKFYIPTLIVLLISATCGIASCAEAGRRAAALSSSYQAATALLEDRKAAEEEVVGKKKAEEIDAAAAKKAVERQNPADMGIYNTKYGNLLFEDEFTGVRFRSSVEAVKDQIRDYSDAVKDRQCLDIGDLHSRWGVPDDDSYVCRNHGWNEAMPEFHESVRLVACKMPFTEEPYLRILYNPYPDYLYDDPEHAPYKWE